jgi:calcineurin-like phosphoesterase family protein
MNLYTSDPHIGHVNIIRYTDRPFKDVNHMDVCLIEALRKAETKGDVFCMGDVSFDLARKLRKYGPLFEHPERHTLIVGNHDRIEANKEAYNSTFGTIVGDESSWRTNTLIVEDSGVKLLLSHKPQRDLQGCDYNLYGHVHNSVVRAEEMEYENEDYWVGTSVKHLCCCVELTEYEPKSLEWILGHGAGWRDE